MTTLLKHSKRPPKGFVLKAAVLEGWWEWNPISGGFDFVIEPDQRPYDEAIHDYIAAVKPSGEELAALDAAVKAAGAYGCAFLAGEVDSLPGKMRIEWFERAS